MIQLFRAIIGWNWQVALYCAISYSKGIKKEEKAPVRRQEY